MKDVFLSLLLVSDQTVNENSVLKRRLTVLNLLIQEKCVAKIPNVEYSEHFDSDNQLISKDTTCSLYMEKLIYTFIPLCVFYLSCGKLLNGEVKNFVIIST